MINEYLRTERLLPSITIAAILMCSPAMASDIADAAMNERYGDVLSLIADGVDVNEPQINGQTALHWAVRNNVLEVTQALITAGADVSVRNRTDATPLQLAAINGNRDVMELLLNNGADPNERVTRTNDSVLMLAARTGVPDAVQILLDYGADIDATETYTNTTALMWATNEGHLSVVKLLIENGADVDAQSLYHPRRLASGTFDTFEGAAPRARRPDEVGPQAHAAGELTALLFAARDGQLDILKALVEAGADMDAVAADGKDGLSLAITNGHYDVASYLIDQGADVNHRDARGFNPLFWAVDRRNMETAPNIPWLVTEDPLPLVAKLLEAGADPNVLINAIPRARMHSGQPKILFATALLRSAFSGDYELTKLLIDHGADPHIKSVQNETTLAAAAGAGFIMGYHRWRPTMDRLATIKLLVEEHGMDVNNYDNFGITPLMAAANIGDVDIIQYLVDQGADLSAHDLGALNPAGLEPLMPVDYALGVGTYRPNSTVVYNEAAAELMLQMMEDRGIEHTTSECTLRGFTCALSDTDMQSATPAVIKKARDYQVGLISNE